METLKKKCLRCYRSHLGSGNAKNYTTGTMAGGDTIAEPVNITLFYVGYNVKHRMQSIAAGFLKSYLAQCD